MSGIESEADPWHDAEWECVPRSLAEELFFERVAHLALKMKLLHRKPQNSTHTHPDVVLISTNYPLT